MSGPPGSEAQLLARIASPSASRSFRAARLFESGRRQTGNLQRCSRAGTGARARRILRFRIPYGAVTGGGSRWSGQNKGARSLRSRYGCLTTTSFEGPWRNRSWFRTSRDGHPDGSRRGGDCRWTPVQQHELVNLETGTSMKAYMKRYMVQLTMQDRSFPDSQRRSAMSAKTLAIIAVSLFVSLSPTAQSDAASLHIPKYFYGDKLGSCEMMRNGRPVSLGSAYIRLKIKGVIGYDWDADHHARSNSVTVRHEQISVPARLLFAASHFAMSHDDPDQIQQAISYVVGIARADTILNTMTVREARNIGTKCYARKGKTSAKCWIHAPQFAAQFAGNYLVSAILLKSKMTNAERRIVDNYARELRRKYIKPLFAGARRERGFNQMANGGISELAYAAWSEDKRLASKTFKRIFKDIRSRFFKDGYINNNSFRGVRGFWYHTYGVNSALAVIGLAKAWNVGVPKVVAHRVRKAVELINVGVVDLNKFDSRKFSGYRGNASTNPRDARPHIHQNAIAIDSMARRYTNVTLKHDAVYTRKRRKEGPSDFTVGFNPVCMVRQNSRV